MCVYVNRRVSSALFVRDSAWGSRSLSLSLPSFPVSLDVCFECVRERVCGRILMKSDSELWQSVKEHPAEVNKLYSSQQLQQAAFHAHTYTPISPVFSFSQNYISRLRSWHAWPALWATARSDVSSLSPPEGDQNRRHCLHHSHTEGSCSQRYMWRCI